MSVPEQVGRYQLQRLLGRGGMAAVYLAIDPRFDREVAVKMLPRDLQQDPTFRNRFEREAKTIASLDHPAIVPVYDYGEEDGQTYLVMRYMAGGSLADHLRGGPMSTADTVAITQRIASALDEAHKKGIVHRDLKPGNILFDQRGDAFLSDFGIVKLAESSTNLTGTGLIGTPAYMSPEQVHGERELDGRSDIYALGLIFYQMLTGELPYKGADTPAKQMMAHVLQPVPRLKQARPDLPDNYDNLVTTATAKKPEERFDTAGTMVQALGSLETDDQIPVLNVGQPDKLNDETAVSPTPLPYLHDTTPLPAPAAAPPASTTPPPTESPKTSRTMLWVGLAIGFVLVFIAGVAAAMFFSGPPPPPPPTPVPAAEIEELEEDEEFEDSENLEVSPANAVADLPPTATLPPTSTPPANNPPPATAQAVEEQQPPAPSEGGPPEGGPPGGTPPEGGPPEGGPLAGGPPDGPPLPSVSTESLGLSAGGEQINAIQLGTGPQEIIIIAGLHAGDSPNTVLMANELLGQFQNGNIPLPPDISLTIIPELNPDSRNTNGLVNANQVDPGRNWDCNWTAETGGTAPFSEPESALLRDWLLERNPQAVIIWDKEPAGGGLIYPGSCDGPSAVSSELAGDYDNGTQFTIAPTDELNNRQATGDMAGWLDQQGIPAITILMPDGSTVFRDENFRAVAELARTRSQLPPPPQP